MVDITGIKELCCGTHVEWTGDIKDFVITSCSGAGAGLFQLEAVTGPTAMALRARAEALDSALASLEAELDGSVSANEESLGLFDWRK